MLETCNLLGCCLSVLSEECSCWLSVCAASSVCCRSTAASSAEPSLTSTTKPDKDPGLGTVFLSSGPRDTPGLALPSFPAALHYPPRSLPAAGIVQEQQHLGPREGQLGVGGDGSDLQRASGGRQAHSGGMGWAEGGRPCTQGCGGRAGKCSAQHFSPPELHYNHIIEAI